MDNFKEIRKLDVSIEEWNKIAGHITNICSNNWNFENSKNKGEEKEDIKIIERIGSESSQGEVYKVEIDGFFFAAKILPIINDKSVENNENEIDIAKTLSNEVINNRTIYFPIVYDTAFCSDTLFNEKSLFYEDSYRYSLNKILFQEKENKSLSTATKKRIVIANQNKSIEELKKEYSKEKEKEIHINSHVMFSELCFSDLREFILAGQITDVSTWNSLILHIMNAVKYLNEDMNIIHGDLHTGNILIKLVNEEKEDKCVKIYPLIHDFGKSRKKNKECDWTMYDRIEDIGKFFYDLLLIDMIPFQIKIKCQKTFDYINEIKNELGPSRPVMETIMNKFLFEY